MLAYCITEKTKQLEIPSRGVAGAQLKWIDAGRLRCFVSDFEAPARQERLAEMAGAFHEVLQRIFAQTSIIPFRFPTVVESEKELGRFIRSRSAQYSGALRRLRDKVQMDVRIVGAAGDEAMASASASGGKYLRNKASRYRQAQSTLRDLRRASNSAAEEWVLREMPSGIRAFALVDRAALEDFLKKIAGVVTPNGISARVTGPWPPSEFVEMAKRRRR